MPNDFIETNIVIGYTVDWDRQSSVVGQYLENRPTNTTLHTSPRVLDEAERVITDRRRIAKQAARRLFQDFESDGGDLGDGRPNIEDVVDFVYSDLDSQRESVRDHVIQHIRDNQFYYTGVTQVDSERGLQLTLEDIDADFAAPLDVIEALRTVQYQDLQVEIFDDIRPDYENILPVYDAVNAHLEDSPLDRDILLDSFRLSEAEGMDGLFFVTLDSDILDYERELEEILTTVDIQHPAAF